MKRKRKSHSDQRDAKRRKSDGVLKDPPTWPLLRQYYPQLMTLRQYLASRLSTKRRKKVLQYGLDAAKATEKNSDPLVAALLDNIVVGRFMHVETSNIDPFDKDLTVFTQQLSNSTAATNPTQLALNQSEVGRHSYGPAHSAPFRDYFRDCNN
jgi:telomerase reverse transcriptase